MIAITYDAIGNPLTYDGWAYTWEAGRQLASMIKGTTNLSFKYNDSGIRTQMTVNGVTTKYTLNGDKVTLEDNGTDKIYYSYDVKEICRLQAFGCGVRVNGMTASISTA